MPKRSQTYIHARKLEILQATQEIALEKGLANTSLRDISVRAGMSMGSIANYFPKRQGIVAFAAEEAQSARARAQEQITSAPDPREALLKWITEIVNDNCFPQEAVLELELVTEAFRSEEIKDILRSNALSMVKSLTSVLVDEHTDRKAARVNARLILALFYGFAALRLLDCAPSKKEVADAMAAAIQSED